MFGTIRSGMATAMHELSVISNNIANANSTAFQRSDVSFADLYGGSSPESVSRLAKGLGASVDATRRSISQGNIMSRDGVLNLAIAGNGMFATAPPTPEGTASDGRVFTRNGEFTLDQNGYMRTTDGSFVLGFGDAVNSDGSGLTTMQVPFLRGGDGANSTAKLSALEIQKDGTVSATYGSDEIITIGRVGMAIFANTGGLRAKGLARFEATATSGDPYYGAGGADGYGQVYSGSLEASNVDLTAEMTTMIQAQQKFSGAARILQTSSDMIDKLTR